MRILICLLFSIVAVDFAAAACDINLRVKNETKYGIQFTGATHYAGTPGPAKESFQVKTRAVPWRNIDKGGWDTSTWNGAHENTATRAVRDPGADNFTTEYRSEAGGARFSFLEPGKTAVGTYEAVLGCGVKRRYRLRFTCHEVTELTFRERLGGLSHWYWIEKDVADKTRYFPGPKQWTEGRNVTIPIKSCK